MTPHAGGLGKVLEVWLWFLPEVGSEHPKGQPHWGPKASGGEGKGPPDFNPLFFASPLSSSIPGVGALPALELQD